MTYNLKCFLYCLFLVVTIFIFVIHLKSKLVKPIEMIASESNLHESSLNVNATDNDATKSARDPDFIHIKECISFELSLNLGTFCSGPPP